MRRLTKKDAVFDWTNDQQESFDRLKRAATEAPILKYYDMKKKLTIETDASSIGLGAALLQEGKPIMYISRSLTPTEQKYAQIEKECLSIVHACVRFDQYVCGKADVVVETDHLPLINIFNRPLVNAPKRLQRMMLRLQRYDIKLIHKRGKEMYFADILSRKVRKDTTTKDDDGHEEVYQVKMINKLFAEIANIDQTLEVDLEDEQIQKIRDETKNDKQL